jgi:hypothetical protein
MTRAWRWLREAVTMTWRVISPFESARLRCEAAERLEAARGQRGEVDALTARLTKMFRELGRPQ